MVFNPHKLGMHKVLKHIPLNAIFDAPYKRMLKRAVNIADLRRIAKARSHKVSVSHEEKNIHWHVLENGKWMKRLIRYAFARPEFGPRISLIQVELELTNSFSFSSYLDGV